MIPITYSVFAIATMIEILLSGLYGLITIMVMIGFLSHWTQFVVKSSPIQRWEEVYRSRVFIIDDDETLKHKCPHYQIDSWDDTIRLVQQLSRVPVHQTIDLILHTNGGSSTHVKLMVDALMQHRGRIRVFIPYKAYSAGTLLALTGHEIYMSPYAHLTPIDTQVVMGESDVFNLSIPVGVLMQLKNFQMDPKALACQVQTYKYRQEYYADHRMMQVIFKHRYTHHQQQAIMKWLHLI